MTDSDRVEDFFDELGKRGHEPLLDRLDAIGRVELSEGERRGYIAYQRRNLHTGLENQCWKDSWDSISYRDGRIPAFPRATCECQGYAYDAKLRAARLARQFWNCPASRTWLKILGVKVGSL